MHETSTWHMQDCVARFVQGILRPGSVLEVGSATAQGAEPSYRRLFESLGWRYVGLDLSQAANVDFVAADPFAWDLPDESFDLIVSGNMLEHNTMFWMSILEMARVLSRGGLMFHIAPSRGYEHKTPMDCWRFYRDGMDALARWAGLECVEATTDWSRGDLDKVLALKPRIFEEIPRKFQFADEAWGDTVGVFRKPVDWFPKQAYRYSRRFVEAASSYASGPQASWLRTAPGGEVVVPDWTEVSLHSVRMRIPDKLLTPTIQKAIQGKKYDHLKVRQLEGLVVDADRVLEIGAGLGFLSSLIARTTRLDALVLVEANPELLPVIRETCDLNGVRSRVIHGAVVPSADSDATSHVSFFVTRNFWGSSLRRKPDAVATVRAPAIALNPLIREHLPTCLICDVEGAEEAIFEGADLRGVRTVMLAIHENIIGRDAVERLTARFEASGLLLDRARSIGSAAVFVRSARAQ